MRVERRTCKHFRGNAPRHTPPICTYETNRINDSVSVALDWRSCRATVAPTHHIHHIHPNALTMSEFFFSFVLRLLHRRDCDCWSDERVVRYLR